MEREKKERKREREGEGGSMKGIIIMGMNER